jgi:hypothetical protein
VKVDIRIEWMGEVRPGVFAWQVPSLGQSGESRQPLLDACRQIRSILGPTEAIAGMFRKGRSVPDISCSVDKGAELTVSEPSKGRIHFAKFREFDAALRLVERDKVSA